MSLWTCLCGVQGIAHDLGFCPVCRKEREVPKTTHGGVSNGPSTGNVPDGTPEEPPVAGPAQDDSPEPAQSPEPEPVPAYVPPAEEA